MATSCFGAMASSKRLYAGLAICLCAWMALAATPKNLMTITAVTIQLLSPDPDGEFTPYTPPEGISVGLQDGASIRIEVAATNKDVGGLVIGRKLEVVVAQASKVLGRKTLNINPANATHHFAMTFSAKWEACTPITIDVTVSGQAKPSTIRKTIDIFCGGGD